MVKELKIDLQFLTFHVRSIFYEPTIWFNAIVDWNCVYIVSMPAR